MPMQPPGQPEDLGSGYFRDANGRITYRTAAQRGFVDRPYVMGNASYDPVRGTTYLQRGMTWSPSRGFGGLLMNPAQQIRQQMSGGMNSLARRPGGVGGTGFFSGGGGGWGGGGGGGGFSGGGGGGWGGGGIAGGGNLTIQDLINMQLQQNRDADAKMEANWQEGKGLLYGIMPSYWSDPMIRGSRGIAQRLLDNPEAISDETQALIRNRLMNTLNAQEEAARMRGTEALSARGMVNPAALARMNERIDAQGNAAMSRALADTEIERALRRNQDYQAAIATASGLGNQSSALQMGVANSFLGNMPQYQPMDLSGMAALIAAQMSNASRAATPVGGGGGFGLGLNNNSTRYGGSMNDIYGALNPMGRASPGQTGFDPGLRGNYQWTGQLSGGGVMNPYSPNTPSQPTYDQYVAELTDYFNSL